MRAYASRTLIVALSLQLAASPARTEPWGLSALRKFSTLTQSQWDEAARGIVQSKVLPDDKGGEVAIMGVVRLRASAACYLASLENIEEFKKSPDVLAIHQFSAPFNAKDLAGFKLQPPDLAGLPGCRIGSCNVKLPATAILRLQHDVGWSRPDHDQAAQAIFREAMLSYLNRYLREGNPALMVYRDKSAPVSLAKEFEDVLEEKPGIAELSPEFQNYLADFPRGKLPGAADFYYWSIENFGLKAFDNITQVLIYRQPGEALVATKQLYASHYFNASLGIAAALDDDGGPAHPGMYLVYLNRSRMDLLTGFWAPLRRAIARDRLEEGMRRNLTTAARKLEASCSARSVSN